jgi:hypothetical protein
MKGPKLKQSAHSYEQWLWNLSEAERQEHIATVKKIVASHIKQKDAA